MLDPFDGADVIACYVSNIVLYKESNITRIDNFVLQLVRDYYVTSMSINDNVIIKDILKINDVYARDSLTSGYIPPPPGIHLFR